MQILRPRMLKQFSVTDPNYSQVLLSDLFVLYSQKSTDEFGLGWRRLTLCFVLAILHHENPKKNKISFNYNDDCHDDTLFEIDMFTGTEAVKMQRMNHCYQNDDIVEAYAKCLAKGVLDEFGAIGKGKTICDKVKKNDDFLNGRKYRAGTHLREICFAFPQRIVKHFETILARLDKPHVVNSFDIELCSLGTFFKRGKMVICFPTNEKGDHSYTPECKYGFQRLTIEYITMDLLLLTFGNDLSKPNAKEYIILEYNLPSSEIFCKRLAFNRPKGTPRENDMIIVPMELLTVYGSFGLVSDEIEIHIQNSFAQSTFLFLRFVRLKFFYYLKYQFHGTQPHTIKCYWSYVPTRFVCNNVEGVKIKDCSFEFQDSISTGQQTEISKEESKDIKFGTSTAGEFELAKQLKMSIGGTYETNSKSSIVEKFVENFNEGRQITYKQELFANPGEKTGLWQQTFTCLNYKYFLPVYAQKTNGRGGEIYHFPEFTPGFGQQFQMREAEDTDGNGINSEDFSAKLPITKFDNVPQQVLHKGICEHPLSPQYDESKCHYIKFPEDLIETIDEANHKIKKIVRIIPIE